MILPRELSKNRDKPEDFRGTTRHILRLSLVGCDQRTIEGDYSRTGVDDEKKGLLQTCRRHDAGHGRASGIHFRTAGSSGEAHGVDVGEIYKLQAAFHRAKTTQDINLMMSLWAIDGTLNNQGDPKSPYIGFDDLTSFWLNSGSFTHRRFSLVPSFKTQIQVDGHQAWLYFECHDVGDSIWTADSSRLIRSWPVPCASSGPSIPTGMTIPTAVPDGSSGT